MYDKMYYHTSLNEMKKFVKLSKFCNDLGIQTSNLSYFLKDLHHMECMSVENLDRLYCYILDSFNKFM